MAMLLSECPEAQVTSTHPLGHKEWDPKPESAAEFGEAVTEPQGMQRCPPPPGFGSLPPKQYISLIGVPNLDESQSLLTPVIALSVVIYRTEITGKLKYEYETQSVKHLHPESPNPRPKITELWVIEWVIHSEACII